MTPQDESYSTYCRERAAECRRRADQTIIREVKAAFREIELVWLASAESAGISHANAINDTAPAEQWRRAPHLPARAGVLCLHTR
jgi:hypothetical protein